MVQEGCPSRTSPGITRGFPRLYPIPGLVTVALLTLAPLALRPVRLACLIHAANVHSEPGSNPSKVDRPGGLAAPKDVPPQTERVEESDWSHRGVFGNRAVRPTPSDRPAAGLESPPSSPAPKTTRPGSLRRPVAGSPQGFTSNKHDPRSTGLSKSFAPRPTVSAGATRPLAGLSSPAVSSPRLEVVSRWTGVILTAELCLSRV